MSASPGGAAASSADGRPAAPAAPPPPRSRAAASRSVRGRVDLEARHQRRLGGVAGRQHKPAHAAPPQALGQRQRAGHRPQRAVEAELADRRQARSVAAVGAWPVASRKASAMGRSNDGPSLRRSAGARLTVMRRDGNW